MLLWIPTAILLAWVEIVHAVVVVVERVDRGMVHVISDMVAECETAVEKILVAAL